MRVPKALKAGDTVAMIGVSGCLREADVPAEVKRRAEALEALGYRVKIDPSCYRRYGYLSGTDEERAAALQRAFADDAVDGVWCQRGGWGCMRMLKYLNWDVMERNPKAFVGYSDITTLHIAMGQRCGLCTFHGPMPGALPTQAWARHSLMAALSGHPEREMRNPPESPMEMLCPGVAEGVLTGGNLSLVAASLGTADEIDVRGKILFLEDVGEEVYALDRYMQELAQAGKLDECAGVLLGQFTNCKAEEGETGFTLKEMLADVFRERHVPVLSGLMAGHVRETHTLPMGRAYRMDAERGMVELLG